MRNLPGSFLLLVAVKYHNEKLTWIQDYLYTLNPAKKNLLTKAINQLKKLTTKGMTKLLIMEIHRTRSS